MSPAEGRPGDRARAIDGERLSAVLGHADTAWLVERIRSRLMRGEALTGSITLSGATPAQRSAAARILGRPPGRGASVSLRLDDVERALRGAGIAPDLRSAVEWLTSPVESRADRLAADRLARARARADALRCSCSNEAWYAAWLDSIERDGTLTRLLGRGEAHLLARAAAVLDALPNARADESASHDLLDVVPLPVLAERATGDTKALSGTVLAQLVRRALALRENVTRPRSAAGRRRLWERAGIVENDLASQVLVLHLRARDASAQRGGPSLLGAWLEGAARRSIPFRITLHQLCAMPVVPQGAEIFVCENPAVVQAAARRLQGTTEASSSDRSAPGAALVCTEGQPSVACDRLLRAATEAGARIHWRNDFDWDGLRMTHAAIARYGATPWRMSAEDYRRALEQGTSDALRGAVVSSPWDPALSQELTRSGRAIMEERLLPQLLADLAASS